MPLQSTKDQMQKKPDLENEVIGRISKTLHELGIKLVVNDKKDVDARSIYLLADVASNLYRICLSDLAWLAGDDAKMKEIIHRKHKELLGEVLARYNENAAKRQRAK